MTNCSSSTGRRTAARSRCAAFSAITELGVAVPITNLGGGWSDPLRIGNAQRESLRQNSQTVYLRHANGKYTREGGNGIAVGDVAVSAKYELAPLATGNLKLAVVAAVEVPAGRVATLDGSGSIDAGAEVIASKAFGRSRVHADVSVIGRSPAPDRQRRRALSAAGEHPQLRQQRGCRDRLGNLATLLAGC